MEASLIYENLSWGAIFKVWGALIFSALLATFGLIISRFVGKAIISWLFSSASVFALLAYSIFGNQNLADPFHVVSFDRIFFVSAFWISLFALISLFVSFGELSLKEKLLPEYFFFVALATAGAIVLAGSKDFLTLFLSMELMSVPIYAMVYALRERIGVEAAFKYFIAGTIFSLLYLLGLAFFFMSEGVIAIKEPKNVLGMLGITLMFITLFFKVGASPFHFWVPDVYQGAPSSTVVFAGAVVKFSAFIAILRVIDGVKVIYANIVEPIIILSIVIGVLSALVQKEIKRIIAYSSVSHSGFIALFLLGIGNTEFRDFFIFYLATYGLSLAGAFAVLAFFGKTLVYLRDVSGFSRIHRFFSLCFAVFMLSFAGLPLFSGFMGKYFAFLTALSVGKVFLVVLAGIGSLISLYFYFLPLVKFFIGEEGNVSAGSIGRGEHSYGLVGKEVAGQHTEFFVNPFIAGIVFLIAISVIFFGIAPNTFFTLMSKIPLSF